MNRRSFLKRIPALFGLLLIGPELVKAKPKDLTYDAVRDMVLEAERLKAKGHKLVHSTHALEVQITEEAYKDMIWDGVYAISGVSK